MILSVDNIRFGYKKKLVFNEANLTIERKGIYGLVAPNGSGKTTLLQLISGLYSIQSGSISVFDTNKVKAKEVSFVQDNTVLYPYLSGKDHLQFICKMHSIPFSEIDQIASVLGMSDYLANSVKTYSLGMKQRLLLSMGLIKKPKLLLLDEPLNGLDPTSTILMRETLQQAAEEGTTILVSSHNLAEMDRITDNVFFIKKKQILEEQLSKMKEEKLIIVVKKEDSKKINSLFQQKRIPFDRKENQFSVSLNDVSANEAVRLLVEQDISLEKIDTAYTGAEMRYRLLFEEEFANDK